jgi:integrase
LAKRAINKLTTLTIKSLVGKKPGLRPDGGCLFAKVDKTTGTVSYVIRYFSPVHQRTRDGGIGAAAECSASPDAITLKEARVIRDEWRKLIDGGIDPIDARKAAKAAKIDEARSIKTFHQAAQEWMAVADTDMTTPRPRETRRRAIETHLSALLDRPVGEITPAALAAALKPLFAPHPTLGVRANLAHRLRGYVAAILLHADRLGTPTDASKFSASYFQGLIPRKEKAAPTQNHPALPVEEMAAFVTRLKAEPGNAARCLLFTAMCALRSAEAISAEWDWIDFNTKIMTIPAAAMKTRKVFRVALSEQAIQLLRSMPRLKGCRFAFPGRFAAKLSERIFPEVLKRCGYGHVTAHGFRSTFRTWFQSKTDFAWELGELSLSHSIGNSVAQSYNRSDALERRFEVMNAWGAFIDPLPVADDDQNVIVLPALLRKASA